jgi:hypothetical protein
MSNEIGERWSVITLTNLSTGNRNLEHEYLIALFADGNRTNPLEYKLNFEGKETQTITVSFGEHQFPILSIYSSNESYTKLIKFFPTQRELKGLEVRHSLRSYIHAASLSKSITLHVNLLKSSSGSFFDVH